MLDCALELNVGRQGLGLVNPEIRIIEGQIIENSKDRPKGATRFYRSRSLQQGQRSNQGHTMMLHIYNP